MGQVTGAINARSGLITPSDTAPERSHQSAMMTIQQTIVRECGNNVPQLAMPSHIRESTSVIGTKPESSIGPLPSSSTCGANPFVVRSKDHSIFAGPVSSIIHGHLISSRCTSV
jgi:hypothetical protein